MLKQRKPLPTHKPNQPSTTPPREKSPVLVFGASIRGNAPSMTPSNDAYTTLLGSEERAGASGSFHGQSNKREAPTSRRPGSSTHDDEDTKRRAESAEMDYKNMSARSQWIVLAVASGACAAFNGVFAKLTTTELTTTFATWVANLLRLSHIEKGVEVVVRAIFFGLNLIFNGIMWALFTKALARGTSTTQVSILNTSSNFMITALLGLIIFSESLPPLWFLGAALLVAGNVIIGRRDEGEEKSDAGGLDVDGQGNGSGNAEGRYSSEDERGGLLGGESVELDEDLELERKRKQDEDDILLLGSESEEEEGHTSSQRLV